MKVGSNREGIRLPGDILDKISNFGDSLQSGFQDSQKYRSRRNAAGNRSRSRKDQRKLSRAEKKQKRFARAPITHDGSDREDDEKGVVKLSSMAETWAALKAVKERKGPQLSSADLQKKAGSYQVDENEEPDDTESSGNKDCESELEDSSMNVDDTWAALKALKQKKQSSSQKPQKENAGQEISMTADDTSAALKTLKDKRSNGLDEIVPISNSKKRKTEEGPKRKAKSVKKAIVKKAPIPLREKQLMAQDEMEIEYWKKKLKIKGYKLPKSEIDDGLDDLLGGLDFDTFNEASGSDVPDWLDDDEDLEGSNFESESDSDSVEGPRSDEEGDETENEENPEDKQKHKENPYVAPSSESSGKYIPPSKRRQMAEDSTKSEQELKLQKLVRGHLNKLTESNIGSIVNELERMYQRYPRQMMTETISDIIIQSTSMQATLLESFLVIHAALVCALYKTVGVEFGAHFTQTLVEKFDLHFQQLTRNPSSAVESKQASNLLSLVSECYSFQLVSAKLMYDIVRMFLDDLSEVKTEFLLKVVRTSGPQMRSDDPGALKEIIYQLQSLVSKADSSSINMRTKFLIESVTALKNNRHKSSLDSTVVITQRMKKFLGSIQGLSSDPLQVSLDDIRSIKTRGKWWVVGAAWTGREGNGKIGPDHDVEAVHDILDAAEPNWMDLARQQRMNTDVRCAIFIALMSSEDFLDAYDRLQRLKLKNKQEREIPRVVLHCCSNEEVYNPFYALVAGKLCETHSLKKTFQFSLWDYVTELQGEDDEGGPVKGQYKDDDDETRIRRISHFARFFASLVGQGSMTLDILKTVNFLAASPNLKLFLEAFFVALFQIVSKRAETAQGSRQNFGGAMFEHKRNGNEVAAMLIKIKDKLVLEGMRYFLPSVLSSSAVGTKKKQVERVKWGVNLAYDMIDEILSNQKEAMSD